ncbi:aspartate aminotransferase family protein [Aestuariivirga sp. YIM B02566]|uniref:Aminotransferase class III-fold pyridoxal phosphate-dependent enzyme n=1 Tax=Taklimakanibacter albus TaxID=2800327 RepID=A0ACC5QZT2_9HYPH|nr:aminotransferase class III-fold pyridoxal phosphate-dependent enzyme [Aestuariivirga sp. YIM B02566]MBK1865917.1 aminotransferase class III-fold pyridoxal phosphate-dependent enzyme [Aestuariivirga sp. YIM B02566]
MTLLDDYLAKTTRSAALATQAAQVFVDGITTDTRSFEPYGIAITRGAGTRKWDVDGNEYRDFFGGHGSLMLGHCHPKVTSAIQKAAARGVQFAANTPEEVTWAAAIKSHVPSAERVRFTGSGTEATLLAIRIARAFTGRAKILRVRSHYHGWHDFAVSGYASHHDGSPAPGILAEITRNTILVAPNDESEIRAAIQAHANELAAVILEPLGSHFGMVPTHNDFVIAAAQAAQAHNVPLILDEIITGFRLGLAGFQGLSDLKPDLTCLAKVAAGGLPGGVVCGSEQMMSVLSRTQAQNKVLHQGTFTGNPVTASAAVATIGEIATTNACAIATANGAKARARLDEACRRVNVPWRVYGQYSSFHILPDAPDGADLSTLPMSLYAGRPVKLLQSLRMAMILESVDIASRGSGFLSAIHDEVDIEELGLAMERALLRLKAENIV